MRHAPTPKFQLSGPAVHSYTVIRFPIKKEALKIKATKQLVYQGIAAEVFFHSKAKRYIYKTLN